MTPVPDTISTSPDTLSTSPDVTSLDGSDLLESPADDTATDTDTLDAETIDVDAPAFVEPTFAELGVQPEIVAALDAAGITHAFPIQALTLPVAMTGHDIIGQAKTGTGKTLGFGIPLLQRVIGPGEAGFEDLLAPNKPQALVVVPTRELAVQVAGDLATAGKNRTARVLTVYGGRAYEPQVEALAKGIEIVVGTPGRLLDLANTKRLDLGNARVVVLDEADEMLDLGFLPDVERILGYTPAGRQTMLFSATMPSAVVALARSYMTQPTHIRAHSPDDTGATVKAVKQFAYRAHNLDKVEMLARMLQARGRGLTMIFARTKRTVAKVSEELEERGFAVGAIHGDLGQGAREQALRAFRNGKVDVLVATAVAARGIDVDAVTHVVNQAEFDLQLERIPAEVKTLMLHCNFASPFAEHADHSLNLTREAAKKLVERGVQIIIGHEHHPSTFFAGKLMIPGNQHPSSVADCVTPEGRIVSEKHCLRINADGSVEKIRTWQHTDDVGFRDIPWDHLHGETLRDAEVFQGFIRVSGKAEPEEVAEALKRISRLRQKSQALVVANAVRAVTRDSGVEEIAESIDDVRKVDVVQLVLDTLTPAQAQVVRAVLEKN